MDNALSDNFSEHGNRAGAKWSDTAENDDVPRSGRRGKIWRFGVVFIPLLAVALGGVWFNRISLAEYAVNRELKKLKLPARYHITDLAAGRQELTNIEIGPKGAPDLRIAKIIIEPRFNAGVPSIGPIQIEGLELNARYDGQRLSFGALDAYIYDPENPATGIPDVDVKVSGAKFRLKTDFGIITSEISGQGNLKRNFNGHSTIAASGLKMGVCTGSFGASGRLYTRSADIGFVGPLRAENIRCIDRGKAKGFSLADGRWDASIAVKPDFSTLSAQGELDTGPLRVDALAIGKIKGSVHLALGGLGTAGGLSGSARTDITAHAIRGYGAKIDELGLTSNLTHKAAHSAEIHATGQVSARAIALQDGVFVRLNSALAALEPAARQGLLAPLIGALRKGVGANMRRADIRAPFVLNMVGQDLAIAVPQFSLRGANGARLASLSPVTFRKRGVRRPEFAGAFRLSGGGFPQMKADLKSTGRSMTAHVVASPIWPDLEGIDIRQRITARDNGRFSFSGAIRASGAIPNGWVKNLHVPIAGEIDPVRGVQIGSKCTPVAFDSLVLATTAMHRQAINVCPYRQKSILMAHAGSLIAGVVIPTLNVAARQGSAPLALRSGPIIFTYPGQFSADDVRLSLGPNGTMGALALNRVTGTTRGGTLEGEFAITTAASANLPIDFQGGKGRWVMRGGVVNVTGGDILFKDRESYPRFNPLLLSNIAVRMAEGRLTANADVIVPGKGRLLSRLALNHAFGDDAGHVKFNIDGVDFDRDLRLRDITGLTEGIVADVKGRLRGNGEIRWNKDGIKSGGAFESDGLDMALGFGPVKGIHGKVVFNDLANLSTAPNQSLAIRSINPGIEARDGVIDFTLRNGTTVEVNGGRWPFLGGELFLQPTTLNFGNPERRKYVLEVRNVDASELIQTMDLSNISARGKFDGVLPIEFDDVWNGTIKNGELRARNGGNLSYIGDLTYKDMGAIANYAFGMLRSLDFQSMSVAIDGSLAGNITSAVRIEKVTQGALAQRNFLTRQLKKLPIRFDLNITAPFYQLMMGLRSLYDPKAVRDPRDLGLVDKDGEKTKVPGTSNAPKNEISKVAKP